MKIGHHFAVVIVVHIKSFGIEPRVVAGAHDPVNKRIGHLFGQPACLEPCFLKSFRYTFLAVCSLDVCGVGARHNHRQRLCGDVCLGIDVLVTRQLLLRKQRRGVALVTVDAEVVVTCRLADNQDVQLGILPLHRFNAEPERCHLLLQLPPVPAHLQQVSGFDIEVVGIDLVQLDPHQSCRLAQGALDIPFGVKTCQQYDHRRYSCYQQSSGTV